MIRIAPGALERRVAASPIWIRLQDAFSGRPPAGPLRVQLERRDGGTWIPARHPHRLSPSGDLAFVNLGRTRDAAGVAGFDVRVTVGCRDMIPEAPGGGAAVTSTIVPWAPEVPPAAVQPVTLTFYPGPGYAFPPGVPVLSGLVVNRNGAPVARVRVFATAATTLGTRTEEARTDASGFFRLPLRWSAGTARVRASLGARFGWIDVSLPADLSTTQRITLT